jgi:hypothetical protein
LFIPIKLALLIEFWLERAVYEYCGTELLFETKFKAKQQERPQDAARKRAKFEAKSRNNWTEMSINY